MRIRPNRYLAVTILVMIMGCFPEDVHAQFTAKWLDIGDYQEIYLESGTRHENSDLPEANEYPAIMRFSGTMRGRGVWIGVKDWTNETGQHFPVYVSRVGPRSVDLSFNAPVSQKLVSRFDDPVVNVDGVASFSKVSVVDEIDSSLPADRAVFTTHNMDVGVTVEQNVYAYSNEHHDNYHIHEYIYTNSGNTDEDPEIELPDQTLKDVFFWRQHRYSINKQAARVIDSGQVWGKYTMIDVVGDGHQEYPVDFTAQYAWFGLTPQFTRYNNLGGPIFDDNNTTYVMEGDSIGRLTAPYFTGRMILHADSSANCDGFDADCYNQATQPYTMGFQDTGEVLTSEGAPHRDYYEFGILTREHKEGGYQGPFGHVPGGRQWPHFADRVEPSGEFWNPTGNASGGTEGGFAPTTGFGPYTMEPGESVRIVIVEGVDGISFDASVQIGRAYKRSGADDGHRISYDANSDGRIEDKEFRYHDVYDWGSEVMTKNQWVMTGRDSLWKSFYKAREVWRTSDAMSRYPLVAQPPLPPREFDVFGRPDGIELSWIPMEGGPPRVAWEVYRTTRFEDNYLNSWYATNCLPADYQTEPACRKRQYELVAALPAEATSYHDEEGVVRGTDYYYYLVAVGEDQPSDPMGITGTPDGNPLRSSRYYTQTYSPANLKRTPYGSTGTLADARIVPNPVNLGADQTVRFAKDNEVAFFNIPGQSTITIYTERGEFVRELEHVDGSGDEKWDLLTNASQPIASGIYIALIRDNETGESIMKKFTVIR